MFICVFFFKQKTAYEMRISDWSSDVCSSDLTVEQSVEFRPIPAAARGVFLVDPGAACGFECFDLRGGILVFGLGHAGLAEQLGGCCICLLLLHEIGRAQCRERVCQYV